MKSGAFPVDLICVILISIVSCHFIFDHVVLGTDAGYSDLGFLDIVSRKNYVKILRAAKYQ